MYKGWLFFFYNGDPTCEKEQRVLHAYSCFSEVVRNVRRRTTMDCYNTAL